MGSQAGVERLPAFVALEVHSVLEGQRTGASVPLDATYFDGVRRATAAVPDDWDASGGRDDGAPGNGAEVEPATRVQQVERSRLVLNTVSVSLDSFERDELRSASDRLRETADRMPEVGFLRSAYPGECVVVPEWVRTGRALDWGLRVYFFREGDAPAPEDIVAENVEAVVDGTRHEFERYQGDLHGYPRCCVEAFHDRPGDGPGPEWRSVEPLASQFRAEALGGGSTSIDGLLPAFFESEDAYSFFAREFFPEPDCEATRETGRDVFDALRNDLGETLARDCFALNYAVCYSVAKSLQGQAPLREGRPSAGDLGMEHFSHYAPLEYVRTLPRYS